jgi:centrosomal protein CEP76
MSNSVGQEEKLIEQLLKEKISSVRHNDERLPTSWDNHLGYLLSTALANYELERLGGVTFANEEFQSSIKSYVPEGHTFKALPIQFTHFDTERMLHHLYQNKIGKDIILARGDQLRHAIRVKIVCYPENVCAIWVMIATRFRSIN